jgi:hypothetical protein
MNDGEINAFFRILGLTAKDDELEIQNFIQLEYEF